mgnify:FL=1
MTFNEAKARLQPALRRRLVRFAREEDGVFTILALFMIMMMVLVGGIQLDFMRHEMERSRLQAVADRAVLAAADLDQTLDPSAVVKDYFAKAGMIDYLSNVTVANGLNFRTVTVDASMEMPTQFLGRFGYPTLSVPARSQAEERVANVEISLVLDISGSMALNGRISELRKAASVFVDTVLTKESQDLISVSVIPYSEQVNAGPEIMKRIPMNKSHDFSHCVEFDETEFKSSALDVSKPHEQAQHFQWNYDGRSNDRSSTVCPRASYERITPLSQNNTVLKNQINALVPRAGTSIFLGMKWATAMLDPSFRSINDGLVTAGLVDSKFSGRPKAYDDPETLKTIILMTDGENSISNRISAEYYNTPSKVVHWSKYNFNYYLYNAVSYSDWYKYSWRKYTPTLGDQLLNSICSAAKQKNIVIWSIGFEVEDRGANVMKSCASSPSHFFRVEGIELSEAFRAIARQINQLRLTQ